MLPIHNKIRICVCGGGNVSHSMAGHLAAGGYRPDILTRSPERWGTCLSVNRQGACERGELGRISSNPAIVATAELVLISVPQFALMSLVEDLLPYMHAGQAVVFVPGVAEACKLVTRIRDAGAEPLILQRVPFICRTERYGYRVRLLGGRAVNGLYAMTNQAYAAFAPVLESLFAARIERIESLLTFLLSISNPILHPARLMELFEEYEPGKVYDRQFPFYHEWGGRASELYMAADDELQTICRACGDRAAMREVISGRVYYESFAPAALTAKIRSIRAFESILSPMLPVPAGWVPDFTSRYFTEDIPYGTRPIVAYASELGIEVPALSSFVEFGGKWIGFNAVDFVGN